jgi:hypothetical protein
MKSSASCEFLCLQNGLFKHDSLWLVQNICLAFSPTMIMVVKLESLIKLAESNGKHQQPYPIRKK